MGKSASASAICILVALLATLVVIPGCGGGAYTNSSAGPAGMGDTPPPVSATNHWGTSFEASEGYQVGNIDGQQGWTIDGWNPRPDNGAITISTDQAATGSQALKLDYWTSTDDTWWMNLLTASSPSVVPNIPVNSVTVRFKIYRTPGETEWPVGSGTMHPNIWFNEFCYGVSPIRYLDFGDMFEDMKIHASLQNSTPRIADDPGWDQVAGRFVDLVIYDNFLLGTRIVWYDGHKVATVPIANPDKLFTNISFTYQAVNPGVPANLGKPTYIDDVDVNWEPAVVQ